MFKNKKGIILIIMLFFFATCLVACGDSGSVTPSGDNENQGTTEPTGDPSSGNNDNDETKLSQYISAALAKLDEIVNPVIAKLPDGDLKTAIQGFYDTEKQYINGIKDLDTAKAAANKVVEDATAFAKNTLKPLIIVELDPYVTALIEKIPYETLKTDTQRFYETEKAKLETLEGATLVNEIKDDLENYALTEAKKIAVAKLEEVVNAGLEKIPNQEFKEDLTAFSSTEIAKLNAVTKIEDVPSTLQIVVTETQAHIKELLVSTVKDYLARLTAVERATAYDYLPAAMCPSFAGNLVDSTSINYDFTSFVKVANINPAGYGEQWQMVVENINQSVLMAKVFNVAQTALSAASNAVDIYITNSYAEEMSYPFSGDTYAGLFEFKNGKLVFNISFTNSVTVPGFGSVQPVIKMEYDLTCEAKGMFISFGDAYKVKYVIANDAYEMATTYGMTIAGKSVSRSSYLSIVKTNNKTTGHIYEYTTYEGSDKIKACADFYVEDGYVSVVGNKSSGMVAFAGYINELYLANSGRLLGYEVREELTVAGVTGTYNTLWFNIWDIQGINSVKVTEKTDANKSSKSTVDVYLNGSSTLLSPTYNTKLSVKTSRKYDIEVRTRYYYSYDSENEKYVANAVEVPMMFIQEGDNFDSFTSDIKKDNSITASVSLNQSYLTKILNDYDTLIDIFIQNKDAMSSEAIVTYLSQYDN